MSHHTAVKLTHEHVQAWLDDYAHAWDTYAEADARALFSDDAEYRWHPADDSEKGVDDIVFGWLNPNGDPAGRDVPGTYKADLQPYAVDGNRAVAVGTCTYWTDASRAEVSRVYYNNWLLEFDDEGKCSSFTEYWMLPRGS